MGPSLFPSGLFLRGELTAEARARIETNRPPEQEGPEPARCGGPCCDPAHWSNDDDDAEEDEDLEEDDDLDEDDEEDEDLEEDDDLDEDDEEDD
jgi:hypothetical protein